MSETDRVLDTLWDKNQTRLTTTTGESYFVSFSRPAEFLDIVIAFNKTPVGFVTLKYEGDGKYSIVNDTQVNPHPTFINTPGHGIEVKTEYRKKGLGAALLSIGIGIAQRDWKAGGRDGAFKVVASDITSDGMGCYQNFGFTIKEGMLVSEGYYSDSEKVPEVNILAGKAPFLKRLWKRLRF